MPAKKKAPGKKESALVKRANKNPVRSGLHPDSTAARLTSLLHKDDQRKVRSPSGSLMSTSLTRAFEKVAGKPGTFQKEPGGKLFNSRSNRKAERGGATRTESPSKKKASKKKGTYKNKNMVSE